MLNSNDIFQTNKWLFKFISERFKNCYNYLQAVFFRVNPVDSSRVEGTLVEPRVARCQAATMTRSVLGESGLQSNRDYDGDGVAASFRQ